jgi:hypothetical protein
VLLLAATVSEEEEKHDTFGRLTIRNLPVGVEEATCPLPVARWLWRTAWAAPVPLFPDHSSGFK